jgi:2',3'-cyclic-nucleotide 2'-phosphodiesterase (5'-nucleotidase family)
MDPKVEPLFTILHFNDVYDIQPNKKGNAGIVNFEAYIRKLRIKYPKSITLFSGDCLSPSILSNIYHGKQMVKALNKLKI